MTGKDRVILKKMLRWASKAQIDYQAVRSEYEPGPFSNPVILTAFSLAQIGELAGHVSDSLREQHGEIPWKQIKGMRNLIIHDYDGIQMNIVGQTVEEDIPVLKAKLEKILTEEQ